MSETRALELRECPFFPPFDRASLAFAFRLRVGNGTDEPLRSAYRISHVYDAVIGSGAGSPLTPAHRERAKSLFGASQSFLDDITTGPPGTNGRPLLLAADAQADARHVMLQRNESWRYDYEGTEVELQVVPPARRMLDLAMHEHFCIFESGLMFYLLVLSNRPGMRSPLDEYAIIQAEQLAVSPELAKDEKFLSIHWGDTHGSLLEFVNRRLLALAPARDGEQPKEATAIGDVLRPFGIIPEGQEILEPRADDLCNAMVQIEDEPLFDTARHAYFHYRMKRPEEVAGPEDEKPKPHPKAVLDADRKWNSANLPARNAPCEVHHARGFGPAEEDTGIPRQLLAFAGMTQGVPDFPRQDDSEIHDSTRPVSVAPENLFFVHPAFEFAVGKNWRTLRNAQESVGACPYALLTWMIAMHDELIVSDMERRIEDMVFGVVTEKAPPEEIGPTSPLHNLRRLADNMVRMTIIPSRQRIIDESLRDRLEIFRWCSIHQSGNVFRYQTERELLAAIREARGTRQRFEDAHDMLDRYENLVEDTASLASAYSSRLTNWLLAAIALFGIASIPKTIKELLEVMGMDRTLDPLSVAWAALLAVFGLFVLWNFWPSQLRRSRKSS